jgi:hypothetical protein
MKAAAMDASRDAVRSWELRAAVVVHAARVATHVCDVADGEVSAMRNGARNLAELLCGTENEKGVMVRARRVALLIVAIALVKSADYLPALVSKLPRLQTFLNANTGWWNHVIAPLFWFGGGLWLVWHGVHGVATGVIDAPHRPNTFRKEDSHFYGVIILTLLFGVFGIGRGIFLYLR